MTPPRPLLLAKARCAPAHLVAKLRRHARLHQHSNPSRIVVLRARQDGLRRKAARRRARHGCTVACSGAVLNAAGGGACRRGQRQEQGVAGEQHRPAGRSPRSTPDVLLRTGRRMACWAHRARARTAGRAPPARSQCAMAMIACQLVGRVQPGSQDAPCACLAPSTLARPGRRNDAGDETT